MSERPAAGDHPAPDGGAGRPDDPVRGFRPDGAAAAEPADDGTRAAWSLEDVYDDETVALIERAAARPPRGTEGVAPRGRSGVAGLLMAGMMTGVADVLDPDRLQPEMVEFSPDLPDPDTMPVQFVYVPGDPQASRLILRPWLFGHLRRH